MTDRELQTLLDLGFRVTQDMMETAAGTQVYRAIISWPAKGVTSPPFVGTTYRHVGLRAVAWATAQAGVAV